MLKVLAAGRPDASGVVGCALVLHARRGGQLRSGSAVTVMTSAEAVGSSIERLSHHHMMSGNVCDGFWLVRRPHNGRENHESLTRAPWGVVG
jgi:hypothetical protein